MASPGRTLAASTTETYATEARLYHPENNMAHCHIWPEECHFAVFTQTDLEVNAAQASVTLYMWHYPRGKYVLLSIED